MADSRSEIGKMQDDPGTPCTKKASTYLKIDEPISWPKGTATGHIWSSKKKKTRNDGNELKHMEKI